MHCEYVTNVRSIDHGPTSNITMVAAEKLPQQLAFCSQLWKKKQCCQVSYYQLVCHNAVSTILHTGGIAQIVWQNVPGIANMIQLSRTFLYEAVTVHSIE